MATRSAMIVGLAVLASGCGGGVARPARATSHATRPAPALQLTTRLPAAYRRVCARQAYVWDHARVSYAISLHGYANEPRVQAMMAALIERVRGA